MLPVLSHMGYRIHNLPTALVSDTLNYPKFYIHDTTEYVRQSLAIWEELGFEFDAKMCIRDSSGTTRTSCLAQKSAGVSVPVSVMTQIRCWFMRFSP